MDLLRHIIYANLVLNVAGFVLIIWLASRTAPGRLLREFERLRQEFDLLSTLLQPDTQLRQRALANRKCLDDHEERLVKLEDAVFDGPQEAAFKGSAE